MTLKFCILAVRLLTGPLRGAIPNVGVEAFSGVDRPDAVFGGVFIVLAGIPLVQLLLELITWLIVGGIAVC